MEYVIFFAIMFGFAGTIVGGSYFFFDDDWNYKFGKKAEAKKSKAFIEGYKDMLTGGLEYATYIEEYSMDRYYYDSYLDHSEDRLPTTYIHFDDNRNPTFGESLMLVLAKQVMDGSRKIDIDAGQYDPNYMGGSAQEFEDYYAGGMALLDDLDKCKQKILDKEAETINRARLIEARKKGLKEVNQRVIFEMEALDELRSNAFTVDKKSFDEQMKEIAQ